MANTFANTQLVTYESLDLLQPNLVFGGSINNDYSKEFGQEGKKVGNSDQHPTATAVHWPLWDSGQYRKYCGSDHSADPFYAIRR
jgi:hypothetical protein